MSSRMGVLDALCPCGCEKYSQENLCDHLEEVHAEMLFMCNIPQCDPKKMYYWKLHHLRNHIQHHHVDFRKEHRNLFDKEKKLIVSNATLANDNIILYPLDLKEFRCRICNCNNASFRSFLLKNAVRHVTETHPTERRPHEMLKYRCRECQRNFIDEPDLQRHINAEHAKEMEIAHKTRLLAPIKEELDSDIEIIELFSSCSFCKDNVPESESRAHLKEHYDSLFQCDACHLGFEEYQKIEEHVLSCNEIPLSNKLNLQRRVFIKLPRQRECLKVFKCCVPNCDRKFIGQPASNLIEHMKASHRYLSPWNNMSLLCRICGNVTTFNSNEELENHINNNHPDETRTLSSDLRSPETQPSQSGVESRGPDCSHLTKLRSSEYQPLTAEDECRYPEYRLQTHKSVSGLPKYRTIQSKDECRRPENRRQTHKSVSGSPQYQTVQSKDEGRRPEYWRKTHKSDSGSPEYQAVQSKDECRRLEYRRQTHESDSGSPDYQTVQSKDEGRRPEYWRKTHKSDLGSPEYQAVQSKDECRRLEYRRQTHKSDSGSPDYQTVESKDECRRPKYRRQTINSDSGSPEYRTVQSKDECRRPGNTRQTRQSDSGSPQYPTVHTKDECRGPRNRQQTHQSDSGSPQYKTVQSKSQIECRSPDNSEYGCEIYDRQTKVKYVNVKRKTSSKIHQDKRANKFSSSSGSSSEEDSSTLEEDTRRKSLAFAKAFNKLKEKEKLDKLRRKKSEKSKSLRRKSENNSDSEITSGNDSEEQIICKKNKMHRESSLPRKCFISRDDNKKKLGDEKEILDSILDRNLSTEKKREGHERRVKLEKLKLHQIEKKIKILSETSGNNLEGSEVCDKKKQIRDSSLLNIRREDGNKETIISENDRGGNLKEADIGLGEEQSGRIVERVINPEVLRHIKDNSDTQTTHVENVTKKKQDKIFQQLSLEKRKGQNRIFNIHCAFCEKDFGDVTEMRGHVSDEHTEMLFKCKLCSKSSKGFETTRGLMEHLKKTHGMNKLLEQIIGDESSRESVQLPEKFLYKVLCSHNSCTTRPELGRNGLWLGRNLTEVKDEIFAHNRLLHRINPLCSDQVQIELSCRACNSFKAVDALGKPDEAKWNKHFNIDHVKRFAHNYKLDKQKKKS